MTFVIVFGIAMNCSELMGLKARTIEFIFLFLFKGLNVYKHIPEDVRTERAR